MEEIREKDSKISKLEDMILEIKKSIPNVEKQSNEKKSEPVKMEFKPKEI